MTGVQFPEVMGLAQAAAYLDVSEDKLYEYVRDCDVPGFKLGNRWKFRKVRLDEWMDKQIARRELTGGET